MRFRCRQAWLCWICVVAIHAWSGHAATPQEVDKAIKKGVEWLYTQQNDKFNWESTPGPGPNARKEQAEPKSGQWGGFSSIATYALLDAGESFKDDRIKNAIDFLNKAPMVGTYAVALRAQVWQYLPQDELAKRGAQRDAGMLLNGMKSKADARGMWGYFVSDGNSPRYDHSTSQIALLGVWACDQAGREVPGAFWKEAENAWRSHQAADGSWSYVFKGANEFGQPKMSMTLAGVATLFITQDYVHLNDGVNCKGNVFDESLVKGTKWIYDHFGEGLTGGGYVAYAMQRVAMASGFKYFGEIDWYQRGAESIVKGQRADGSWGNGSIPETAFAMLFLSRGRAPVVLNKFEYELEGPAPKVVSKLTLPKTGPKADNAPATPEENKPPVFDGNWCQRPRDVAMFTRWMSHMTERKLNWQIISNRVPVDDFHDAPVLFMSGNQKLDLPAETIAKLRQYALEGGLIFGHADCGSKEFTDSFVKLGTTLFPAYEFRELPPEHPIYTTQQFARKNWKSPPSVKGLSNGARELMIILPNNDIAKLWQQGTYLGKEEAFQVMDDIVLYAVDRQNLKYRGSTHIVRPSVTTGDTGKPIKVARVEYPGNWSPEPAGWTRLAAILKNQGLANLTVEQVKLGEGKLDVATYPLAHLTGTGAFSFTKDQQNELKKFVIKGGVILCDAAGGDSSFAASAEKELSQLIGGSKFDLIKPDDAVLAVAGDKASDSGPMMMSTPIPPPPSPSEAPATQPTTGPATAPTTQATMPAFLKAMTATPATAPASQPATAPAEAATQASAKVVLPGNFIVEYRKWAQTRMGASDTLRLKGISFKKKWAVIFSAEDLSTGMVGEQVDGIYGYSPSTSTEIMRRLVYNLAPAAAAATQTSQP